MSELLHLAAGAPAHAHDGDAAEHVRVAIVGGGFAGLGLAIRCGRPASRTSSCSSARTTSAAPGRPTRIPAASATSPRICTRSPSRRTRTGAARTRCQPEIWDYLRDLAERHDLRRHIRFGHELTGAAWDEDAQRWRVDDLARQLDRAGPRRRHRAAEPAAGAADPRAAPLRGQALSLRRVGPRPRPRRRARRGHRHGRVGDPVRPADRRARRPAARLPAHGAVDPSAHRSPDDARRAPPLQDAAVRPEGRPQRDLLGPRVAGRSATSRTRASWPAREQLAKLHLRKQVADPELRRALTPDFRLGCKRVLLSNHWYPALARPNVEVVTDAIREIRGKTIVLADGSEREVDTIILGTGFHVTDPPTARLVRGRDGRTLRRGRRRPASRPTAARRSAACRTSSRSSARTPASATTR